MTDVIRTSNEKVYMCIRVLEDGEREKPTHFRVVDAGAYEEAIAEIAQLKATTHETPAVNPFRSALERLASMESFTGSRSIKLPEDAELIARIEFAQLQLAGANELKAREPSLEGRLVVNVTTWKLLQERGDDMSQYVLNKQLAP